VQAALGRFYESTGRPDDAIAAYRRAIALDAQQPEAHISLGNALRNAGDLDGAIATHGRAIALAPNRPDTWSNLLLTLQCSDGISAREIAEKHREFGRYFSKLLLPLPPSPRAPLAGRRLKIGYLSSHFRRHAVAKFFQALIRAHDVRMFEIHCYYSGAASDDITEEIRGQVEHFAPVHGMRDGYVAAQIRRDGIDILVDVDGHTAFNRLAVFFLKPAPVQVTWLGYLATTGVPAIDFRLTDARADPPGLADELHTETLWRLPSTAWCYQPYAEAPPVASPPVAANGFPTLVSLNDPAKVTPSVLELWARIMREVPRSRLILHTSRQPSRIFELEAFFAARGVAASRVDLVERRSIGEYFVLYNRADIALDTWPCAGGTTTCDALWMGVPVVTLTGEASYSRTGASLLASLGMDEFVNATGDAYVATAVALARDPPRLAQLRAQLRPRMLASCLTDGVAFAREVEAAFVGMWEHRSMSSGPRRAGSS
jgi:predicted O-linked N-acetylglucosamine transferase (SPINDLY family)